MKKIFRLISYILVAAIASAVTFGFCCIQSSYSKLDELESLILDCFIGETNQTDIEDAAANAMVDALGDRWSYYIPASNYETYIEQSNNAYVGIGITITPTEDEQGLSIVAVNSKGPAADAGLVVGDVIVAIEGNSTAGMTTTQARNLVKGEPDTTVSITVMRSGEAYTIFVTRKNIETEVAVGEMLTDSVGLVTIVNFDTRCADETINEIENLLKEGAKALIFDVRGNPGGYASELVKVLDYLLPEGEIFHTIDYKGKEQIDTSDASCVNIPMAVLIDDNSYSAAEFFAAALMEYEAAFTVGEQTCGKGYFQNVFQLEDGSGVGLSIGKYYTPKGENLAGIGIHPDFVVPLDDAEKSQLYSGLLEPIHDIQIQTALENLEKQLQRN